MEKIINYLKQLELSDIEARLYLALLKSGATGVKELAQAINIKRTTAYIYVDLLVEKGLVIKTVKGSRKQVAAINPEEGLEELVKQKIKSAEETKSEFSGMLEAINQLTPSTQAKEEAEIKYYKGKGGVKKIYDEVLKTTELRSYVNIEEIANVFPENFPLFDSALKRNTDMVMYEIVENSPEAKKRFDKAVKRDRYFYKFLPENMKLTAQDILIYDNKVAIIHFKDSVSGIVLESTDLYTNFKLLFDFVWKVLPNNN